MVTYNWTLSPDHHFIGSAQPLSCFTVHFCFIAPPRYPTHPSVICISYPARGRMVRILSVVGPGSHEGSHGHQPTYSTCLWFVWENQYTVRTFGWGLLAVRLETTPPPGCPQPSQTGWKQTCSLFPSFITGRSSSLRWWTVAANPLSSADFGSGEKLGSTLCKWLKSVPWEFGEPFVIVANYKMRPDIVTVFLKKTIKNSDACYYYVFHLQGWTESMFN